MLCCVCKEKEATVHLTQIAGDKMQKASVCEECHSRSDIKGSAAHSLVNALLGIGGEQDTRISRKEGLGYAWSRAALADFLVSNKARLSYYAPRARP